MADENANLNNGGNGDQGGQGADNNSQGDQGSDNNNSNAGNGGGQGNGNAGGSQNGNLADDYDAGTGDDGGSGGGAGTGQGAAAGGSNEIEKYRGFEAALTELEALAQINPNILAEIDNAKAQRQGKGKKNDAANNNASGDNNPNIEAKIEEALAPVKGVLDEYKKTQQNIKAQTIAKFEANHPESFGAGIDDKRRKEIRAEVGIIARSLVEKRGLSYAEALEKAHNAVNPEAIKNSGRDEAYLEMGGNNAASFNSQGGGTGNESGGGQGGGAGYTRGEIEAARKLDPTGRLVKEMMKDNKRS